MLLATQYNWDLFVSTPTRAAVGILTTFLFDTSTVMRSLVRHCRVSRGSIHFFHRTRIHVQIESADMVSLGSLGDIQVFDKSLDVQG